MILPEKNISLAPFTSYNIGGSAREVYFPENAKELQTIIASLSMRETEYFFIGGGSNLLVGDGFYDGAVIITTRLNKIEIKGDSLVCGAGLSSTEAAETALDNGKTGLEFLYKLPGSVGGAVAGNARFDDVNISDALISLVAVHPKKGIRRFDTADIDFSYKHNSLIRDGWYICETELAWKDGDPQKIRAHMDRIEQFREESRHFEQPSCGCIFKNDHAKNIQVGRLLDSFGLKGMRKGGAEVADFHANFIVNTGNATARNVLDLIEEIESIVEEKTGHRLEREVRLVGNFVK